MGNLKYSTERVCMILLGGKKWQHLCILQITLSTPLSSVGLSNVPVDVSQASYYCAHVSCFYLP